MVIGYVRCSVFNVELHCMVYLLSEMSFTRCSSHLVEERQDLKPYTFIGKCFFQEFISKGFRDMSD